MRLPKREARGQYHYSSTAWAKIPWAALLDRDFAENGLLVLALIAKNSGSMRNGTWREDWCRLSAHEMARQLHINVKDVRAALDSPYVSRTSKLVPKRAGHRVRVRGEEHWAPLPLGVLGGPDDPPAVTGRELLVLTIQTGMELENKTPMDCVRLSELTRTSTGRQVSAYGVQYLQRELIKRGWVPAELAEEMRRKTPVEMEGADVVFSEIFNSSQEDQLQEEPQVSAPVEAGNTGSPRETPRDTTISGSVDLESGGKRSRWPFGFGRVKPSPAVPRATDNDQRKTSPMTDVDRVRQIMSPVVGQDVITYGMQLRADQWIAAAMDRDTPVERMIFRVSAALVRYQAGELFKQSGEDGLAKFIRFILSRPQGCLDPGCEDGLLWDYAAGVPGKACRMCMERVQVKADAKRPPAPAGGSLAAQDDRGGPADRVAPSTGPYGPPVASGARVRCRVCEVPFADRVPPGAVCRECRDDAQPGGVRQR